MAHIFRIAWKSLRRDPWFAVAAIAILSVAAGVCTSIFSALEAVLLKPLPFREPSQLVLIQASHPTQGRTNTSRTEYNDWRARNQVFADIAAVGNTSWNLVGIGEAERLSGKEVTSNFFPLLGAHIALGRALLADDTNGVILSHALWQQKFGSDPNVPGTKIALDGAPFTIIGVASGGLIFPEGADVWTLLKEQRDFRRNARFQVVGRLKPGVTFPQAQANMRTVAKELEQEYPQTNSNWSVALTPLEKYVAGDAGFATQILFGAVMLVLLIACANVANLLLARSSSRQTETAVRMALGASRGQLVQEFLVESAAISIPAIGLGLLLAASGTRVIAALPIPHAVRLRDTGLDLTVFVCASLLAVFTTFFFGLVPFLNARKIDIQRSLKESGRASTGSAHQYSFRRALVAAEFAIAMILLVSAGLLIRTFVNLQNTDLGFRPSNVLTMRIIRGSNDSTAFIRELLARIQSLPGVQSAGVAVSVPLSGRDDTTDFTIEGRPAPPPDRPQIAGLRVASPNYFKTMGIPLLTGRFFTEADDEALKQERVGIINEALARRYFPDTDPIGQRVSLGGFRRIVGVVGDVHHSGFDAPAEPEIYAPYALGSKVLTLAVRTGADSRSFIAAIRAQVAGLDPNQPVFSIQTMDNLVSDTVAMRRYSMSLIAIFSVFALLLAVFGVYSVMAHWVAQRTAEIGIRIALGAESRSIRNMVVQESGLLIGLGIAVGLAGALGLTRLLGNLLYHVTSTDPAVMLAAVAMLTTLGIAAALRPAMRAGNVDPVSAIRQL
jgi:predicted permease